MSKQFRYKNGYVGTVSDAVAVILEKKGEGKAIGDAKAKEKADAKEKAEAKE